MQSYSIDINNITCIYGTLLSSINTIWNIYVVVYLGTIGWLVVRARDLSKPQKVLTSITITVFSFTLMFYFYDAYTDLNRLMVDFTLIVNTNKLSLPEDGFFNHLITFNYHKRLIFTCIVIFGLGGLLGFIIWSKGIWKETTEKT